MSVRTPSGDAPSAGSSLSRLGGGLMRRIARRPADSLALTVALGIVGAIVVNAVALQAGPHPAPLLAAPPAAAVPSAVPAAPAPPPKASTTGSVAAKQPVEAPPEPREPAKRTRAQLLSDLQKELARRGYYDGAIDGVMGPKMEAAIRAFEQAAKIRVTGEASEALLKAVQRAPVKKKAGPSPATGGDNGARRVLAVQRALTDYGYGPLPPTGKFGEATRAAVEKFERDRKLPPTGRLSERVLRELAAVTGRTLD